MKWLFERDMQLNVELMQKMHLRDLDRVQGELKSIYHQVVLMSEWTVTYISLIWYHHIMIHY